MTSYPVLQRVVGEKGEAVQPSLKQGSVRWEWNEFDIEIPPPRKLMCLVAHS